MKKLVLASLLSLPALAILTPASPAGLFHPCCRHGCFGRYSLYLCCRQYNAFDPICVGNINCIGCCFPFGCCPPLACGAPLCGAPSCPPVLAAPSVFADCCPPAACSNGCCDPGCLPAPAPANPSTPNALPAPQGQATEGNHALAPQPLPQTTPATAPTPMPSVSFYRPVWPLQAVNYYAPGYPMSYYPVGNNPYALGTYPSVPALPGPAALPVGSVPSYWYGGPGY